MHLHGVEYTNNVIQIDSSDLQIIFSDAAGDELKQFNCLQQCLQIVFSWFHPQSIPIILLYFYLLMFKESNPNDYLPTTESETPPNLEPYRTTTAGNAPNQQLIHKIIASNEQLISQQMTTIRQLKRDNHEKDNYIKAITLKYNELLLFASQSMETFTSKTNTASTNAQAYIQSQYVSRSGGSSELEAMISKIIDLQQQLSTAKVESAMKSAELLSYSIKRRKSSCSSSPRRKTQTLSKSKKILEEYFEPRPLERQSVMLQNKTSVESNSILENWNKVINTYGNSESRLPLFKEKSLPLIKKFVPKQLRNVVWMNLIENRVGMSNSLYLQLLERREQNWVSEKVRVQIEKDIKRSFYGKTEYERKGSLIADVCQFLQIFHIFRPDVSYVQGMTYPAIILIPILGKARAFNLFCNLILGNSFFRKTFSLQDNFVETSCRAFQFLLKDYQPTTYQKLRSEGIQSQIFLIEWMFTLFGRGFHLETTVKFWDHLIYFEQLAVFRMGLSVFEQLGPLIINKVYEEAINIIRDFGRRVDEERLLQCLSSSKLSHQRLWRTFEKASGLQS